MSDTKRTIFKYVGYFIAVVGIILLIASVNFHTKGDLPLLQYIVFCLSMIFTGVLSIAISSNTTQKLKIMLSLFVLIGYSSLPIINIYFKDNISNPFSQIAKNPMILVSYMVIIACFIVIAVFISKIPFVSLRLTEVIREKGQEKFRLIFYQEDMKIIKGEPVTYFYDTDDAKYFKLNRLYKVNQHKITDSKNQESSDISKYSKCLNNLKSQDFKIQSEA